MSVFTAKKKEKNFWVTSHFWLFCFYYKEPDFPVIFLRWSLVTVCQAFWKSFRGVIYFLGGDVKPLYTDLLIQAQKGN